MSSTEVKLLYDFKYVIPGGVNEIVHLKSGESFVLIEEKGERWISVKRPDTYDVYYLPVNYVEQFHVSNDPNSQKRLTPPKPPYKPKNLLQRLQNNQDNDPPSPPPIDEESFVELYNLLSKRQKEEKTAVGSLDKKQKLSRLSQGESLSDEKLLTEVEAKGNISKKDKELKDTFLRRGKEQAKKVVPVPKPGELPLKIFPNGFETYRDDISGQIYYYNTETRESSWALPRVDHRPLSTTSECTSPSYTKMKSSSEDIFSHKSWQHGTRSGLLSRTKLTENGGKLKKYWNQVFVVLEGTSLYFFKDQKSSSNKGKSDLIIHLPSSFVLKGGSSNKQNLIHIILASGTEYLLHSDTQEVVQEWFDVLSDLAKKEGEPNTEINEGLVSFKNISDENQETEKNDNLSKTKQKSGSSTTLDQQAEKTSFKEKLKLWLLRRPTQDSLREKGIYKDPIFGSSLSLICKKENTSIPSFVTKCIETVEKEGLDVDGIYRVNGNASDIQKLRFAINQNTPYNLSSLDIHVVTGSLKLFFRELQEPLFPFEHYQPLMDAFAGQKKVDGIKHILETFPNENYLTLKELLRHLLLIVQHSAENRMRTTNLAIIFGPTLLWPKESCDHETLALSLMTRGQLVEFLIHSFDSIFT